MLWETWAHMGVVSKLSAVLVPNTCQKRRLLWGVMHAKYSA